MNWFKRTSVILIPFCIGLLTMAAIEEQDDYNNCRDDNTITVSYVIEQHKEWKKDCDAHIKEYKENIKTIEYMYEQEKIHCENFIKKERCTLKCIRDTAYASDFDTAVDHCLRECGQKDEEV